MCYGRYVHLKFNFENRRWGQKRVWDRLKILMPDIWGCSANGTFHGRKGLQKKKTAKGFLRYGFFSVVQG